MKKTNLIIGCDIAKGFDTTIISRINEDKSIEILHTMTDKVDKEVDVSSCKPLQVNDVYSDDLFIILELAKISSVDRFMVIPRKFMKNDLSLTYNDQDFYLTVDRKDISDEIEIRKAILKNRYSL